MKLKRKYFSTFFDCPLKMFPPLRLVKCLENLIVVFNTSNKGLSMGLYHFIKKFIFWQKYQPAFFYPTTPPAFFYPVLLYSKSVFFSFLGRLLILNLPILESLITCSIYCSFFNANWVIKRVFPDRF